MATKLMEEILSEENLDAARKAVKRNRGSCGVDGMKAEELDEFIQESGKEICDKIRNRKYKPLPVRRVQIPKPDGSKRDLGIPSVKDRWIQQAVYQVLSPIFEKEFSETSYGFRPGRRCENAIIKALEYMNDGYDWIVDMDLSKFFDNVNQDILMILVHHVIHDPDTESLIRKILQSGVMVEGVFQATDRGTPQGGNLSPLLANIYLNQFDKELERRGLRYTRYADDVIICVHSEVAANRVMKSVVNWLEKHLKVQVNATKTKVCRPNEMKYLGYSFFTTRMAGNRNHT
ncbi:group II intron reverse transcriptase/maturase [Stecheria intestinalis]|uniref:group II intron reverse transcriptase/maturase n=1 Tax=Stecheria intestinalis TaxID=2606630 RepID=UPI001F2DA8C9|nr:group II intron reverse transcriptase/maturase [Stecheria intestinalis]